MRSVFVRIILPVQVLSEHKVEIFIVKRAIINDIDGC